MGRPRTDIEPRILHAARAAFLESGVDGASLRTIARGARTSVGMIYYYFRTKDELFFAVVEEVYVKLLGDLSAALAGGPPVRPKLEKIFQRVGAATEEELAVVRLVAREALSSASRFERIFARFQRGHVALLVGAFGQAMAAGEVDDTIPLPMAMVATLALGVLPQFLRRVAGDRPPFSTLPAGETLARLSGELLFRGIAAHAAAEAAPPAGEREVKRPARRPPRRGGARS